MTARRAYRKAGKKIDLSDAGCKARKAKKYAFKAKAAREFREKGVVARSVGSVMMGDTLWDYGTTVLTRSAKTPGEFQVTRFDKNMTPTGDSPRKTIREALDVLHDDTIHPRGKLPLAPGMRKPARAAKIRFGRLA